MQSFKQFLTERSFRNDPQNARYFFQQVTPKISPKEFEKHIQTFTQKALESETQEASNPYGNVELVKKMNRRDIDKLMAAPELTDEHHHRAIPHLLNYNYKDTLENLDIPWTVMKSHAEILMVAIPNKDMVTAFNAREAFEKNRTAAVSQKQSDTNPNDNVPIYRISNVQ